MMRLEVSLQAQRFGPDAQEPDDVPHVFLELKAQGVEWMVRFHTQLYAFEPVTEREKILYGETLSVPELMIAQGAGRRDRS